MGVSVGIRQKSLQLTPISERRKNGRVERNTITGRKCRETTSSPSTVARSVRVWNRWTRVNQTAKGGAERTKKRKKCKTMLRFAKSVLWSQAKKSKNKEKRSIRKRKKRQAAGGGARGMSKGKSKKEARKRCKGLLRTEKGVCLMKAQERETPRPGRRISPRKRRRIWKRA